MSIKTYKFKLYKSKKLKHLHKTVNISAIIYNHCIALHKRYFKLFGKHLNKFLLQKHLTKLKKLDKFNFYKEVPSQAIQNITERIDSAYKKFFDYTKGKTKFKASPPNFKKVKKYRSFTLKGEVGYKIENRIFSFNNYRFKFVKSREIDGKIKNIVIKRDNFGDFYLCICLEIQAQNNALTGKSVDMDFGLKTFLTLNNGEEIKSPLFYFKNLKTLKTLNKTLSKKEKGSNNRKEARFFLAKAHTKVANQRRDFFHKLSNDLAKKYDKIFIEDLNLKAMQKLWGRKINDLAFAEFVNILSYKTKIIKIDRFYPSSKTCSKCGFILEKLDVKIRTWTCPSCKVQHQRDVNAAINIKRVGALSGESVRAIL